MLPSRPAASASPGPQRGTSQLDGIMHPTEEAVVTVLDVNIDEPAPWKYGLAGLAAMGATASVVVEGLDSPVEGVLVEIAEDRGLLIEQREAGTERGTVMWVPLARVVSVSAPYRRRDVAAEHRARIEADTAFLSQIRELAVAHAGRTRQIGRRTFKGLMAHDVVEEVQGYSTQDVAVALSILAERGELPTGDD